MQSRSAYRPDIDGLRAFAVGGVLLCHYKIQTFSGGFAGVDVFFVISGFLITNIVLRDIEAGTFNFKDFYVRRTRRLLPALYCTLLLSLLAATVLFSPEKFQDFSKSMIAAALSVSNFLFWSQAGYFDPAANLKPLLHTWSLGIEEQFYLLWPATLFLAIRFRAPVFALLIVLFAASFAANIYWRDHSSTLFYLLPFRVFEFAVGGLALLLAGRVPASEVMKATCALTGLAAIIASYLIFNETSGFPYWPALIPCFGAALVLIGGTSSYLRPLLANRALVWIGKISYSLYLVHWPIVVFYEYTIPGTVDAKGVMCLAAVTILAAWSLYETVEKPFRLKAGQKPDRRSPFYPALLATTAAIVIAGYAGALSGWTWRLGAREAAYLSFNQPGSSSLEATYGGAGCNEKCETNPGKPLALIVIGDSHAQQYFAGFKVTLPDKNVLIFHFSSCQMFSLEYTRDFSEQADPTVYDKGCRKARADAFAAIKRSSVPVVLSHYWAGYSYVSERDGRSRDDKTIEKAAEFAVSEALKLKDELGIRQLIFMGSVPGAGSASGSLDCMARPLGRADCATKTTDAFQATRAQVNAQLSSRLPDTVAFVDPFRVLCTDGVCDGVLDGTPVYTDRTHLTKWAAERVIRSGAKAWAISSPRP